MVKKQKVELLLPVSTMVYINRLAEQGILGNTPDAVVEHCLRQYLFDQTLKQIGKSS